MRPSISVLVTAAVLAAAAQADAAIIINQPSQVSSAATPNGVQPGDFAVPTSLPFTRQITATADTTGTTRFAEATSDFDFTNLRFITSADHSRDNGGYTLTQTDLLFTPQEDMPYSLTGSSTAEAGSRFHSLYVRLRQGQFGPILFEGTHSYGAGSIAPALTSPQTFTLGQSGSVSGQSSGTLLAGTMYHLFVAIEGRAADEATTSGNGTVTLSVPEPATLGIIAGAGMVLLTRRRRP